MKANTVRDIFAGLGVVGIGASTWLTDWRLVPGIVGALLLVAAILSAVVARGKGGRS